MQKPPEQPQFPHTAINITPDGMVITTMIAQQMGFTQMINEEQMNAICSKWLETRKQIKDEMNIIDLVQRSKIK